MPGLDISISPNRVLKIPPARCHPQLPSSFRLAREKEIWRIPEMKKLRIKRNDRVR